MKLIPPLLWLAGLALFLYGAGSYATHGLPYPDPTPELLALQSEQRHTAQLLAFSGAALVTLGAWLAFRRCRGKGCSRSPA